MDILLLSNLVKDAIEDLLFVCFFSVHFIKTFIIHKYEFEINKQNMIKYYE